MALKLRFILRFKTWKIGLGLVLLAGSGLGLYLTESRSESRLDILNAFFAPSTSVDRLSVKTGIDASSVVSKGLDSLNVENLLQELRGVTSKTANRDAYQIFQRLKERFGEYPEELVALDNVPYTQDPKNADEKRQLSIIYGALAQSKQAAAWPYLAKALAEGQSEFVGFQAVSAAADFRNAPDSAYAELSAVAKQHPVPYIRSSAQLALGSVARSNDAIAAKVQIDLLEAGEAALSQPRNMDVVLAAMGNHGSSQYLEFITKMTRHSDERVRARAVFALRGISEPEVQSLITQAAITDPATRVKEEGIKALAERAHFEEVVTSIGAIGESSRDDGIQAQAARIVKNLSSSNKSAAIDALRSLKELSLTPTVKTQIVAYLDALAKENQQ